MSPGELISGSIGGSPIDSVSRLVSLWAVICCVTVGAFAMLAVSVIAFRIRKMEKDLEEIKTLARQAASRAAGDPPA